MHKDQIFLCIGWFVHLSKQNKFLALILLFVAFDVICDNYITGSFRNEHPIREGILFVGLLLFQIVVSPMQAGVSDVYGRKPSLLISMFFSFLSLGFIFLFDLNVLPYLPMLLLLVLSKGLLGNTVPIAWASIGDMEGKNFRFSFALATASYAIGYLVLIFLNESLSNESATALLALSFIFLLFFCYKFFNDLKDIRFREIHRLKVPFFEFVFGEILLIIKDIKNRTIQMLILSWILWEISIYSILLLYADFFDVESSMIEILMMVGYLCGTLSMKFFSRINDAKMIRIGYKISVVSLIPYFLFTGFIGHIDAVLAVCYFFHAVGNAFLSPTMFSIISKMGKDHARGKIYGLAESGDTIAFLIAGLVILIYRHYSLEIFWLALFSFLTVLVSWFPYRKFEEHFAKIA